MRIKIEGQLIEKTKPNKTNYFHETYSMILNNLKPITAEKIHSHEKFFRLFTFSNVYIQKKLIHFYLSGEDSLIQEIIDNFMFNQLIRIDDMVIEINNIEVLPQLLKKDKYFFKTNLIINISQDNKCVLCDDETYIEKRVSEICLNKAKSLNFNIEDKKMECILLNKNKKYDKYKNQHIESWNCKLILKGDYDLINFLYNIGIGENTATGHGLLWEVT